MRISDWSSDVCSSDLSDGLGSDWADKLRNFAWISVRDENSRQLIRDALGQEPELVLDPCLQFPAEIQTPRSGSERPYVAVYGHNFPASFRQAVRHWAASRGYRLLSIEIGRAHV